jgi:2-methylcitrate dehydratase
MDASISRIADYASTLGYQDLPAEVVHESKRRLIDTVGCALGAFDDEPSRIARTLASRVEVPGGARVFGTGQRALPELAAFANGVMARYLDGNDVFPGGGHPSDVIPAVLAAVDVAGADGPAAITAIVLAYEIYGQLFRAARMRDRGLDHVFYTAVASAVGAARVLGLDRARIAQAVALAVTPNIALHATRRGELSMWKGVAAGNAARNGIFATLLAARGMTGPDKAIDGSHGLRELLGNFELGEFGGGGRPFQLPRSDFKFFLTEFHSQSPVTAAIELRRQVAVEDIEAVTVHTYWFAWSEIGSEPEKWHPTTRESADHSLPYIVAAVLDDPSNCGLRIFRLDEIEVAFGLGFAEIRNDTLVDPVRVYDDPAFGGLPEDLGQAHHRDGSARDHISQDLAGADRRQLIGITNNEQGCFIWDRLSSAAHPPSRFRRLPEDRNRVGWRHLVGSRRPWD